LAVKKLPSCLKKRDILNSDKADNSELIRLGQGYLQEGFISDCIDFFEKAEHFEGLLQLKAKCTAEGDYFLYHRLVRILQDSPSPEEWTELGDKALGLGKLLFASLAYKRADNQLLQLPRQERTSAGAILH